MIEDRAPAGRRAPLLTPRPGTTSGSSAAPSRWCARAHGSDRAGTACRCGPTFSGCRLANVCIAAVGRNASSSVRWLQPDAAHALVERRAEAVHQVEADELSRTPGAMSSQPSAYGTASDAASSARTTKSLSMVTRTHMSWIGAPWAGRPTRAHSRGPSRRRGGPRCRTDRPRAASLHTITRRVWRRLRGTSLGGNGIGNARVGGCGRVPG